MIRRREFITLLGGAAAVWPLAARAQQRERVRRIGVLLSIAESDPEAQRRIQALRQGLQEWGWIEGRNVSVEYRFSAADAARIAVQVADLVALKPDVIVGNSTPVVTALRQATSSIPVVFVQIIDPVGSGLVDWHGPAATSPASATSNSVRPRNGWNYSRRSRQVRPGSRPFCSTGWRRIADFCVRSKMRRLPSACN